MPIDPARSAGFEPVAVASLDREQRRRSLVAASAAMMLLGPILGAGIIAAGFSAAGIAILVWQLFNLAAWLLLRKGKLVDLCGWLLLGFGFAAAALAVAGTGGLASGALPWLLLLPVLAGYFFGRRGVLILGGLAGLFLAGMIGWEFFQEAPVPPQPREAAGALVGFAALGSLALLVLVSSSLLRSLQRSERARRESEHGFQDSLEQLPDGFLVLEPSLEQRNGFREVFRNRAAAGMLERLEEAGYGLFQLQTGLRGPRLRLDFARLAMDGRKLVVRGLRHSAFQQVFDLTATRWGRSLLVCLRETTRDQRTQAELTAATAVAAEAGRAKSDFLGSMSDEIRAPMNGVLGMTRLALETVRDAETEEYLATIHSCADSLLHLLNDILDISRIEAGKLELEATRFDLQEVLDACLDALAPRAAEQGIEWNAFRRPDVPRWLFGDPTRLRQVLLNLAGNAIKFTAEGEVAVELSVVGEAGGRTRIRVAVRDTGVGIPADRIPKLFERLSQAEDSNTWKFGGTGLGLALSSQLVEKMGGRLGVESVEGEGSLFSFEIELEQVPAPPGALGAHDGLAGRRVLVVDPGATTARVLCIQLRELGCRYDSAAGTEEAAERIQASFAEDDPYDAVLGPPALLLADGADALRGPAGCKTRWITLRALGEKEAAAGHGEICGSLRRPARPGQLRKVLLQAFGLSEAAPLELEAEGTDGGGSGDCGSDRLRLEGRVLLAEGDPVNRKLLQRMLKRAGVEADLAENGPEALQRVQTGDHALLLMDCRLPELDGFEVTRRIRGLDGAHGRLPVVAMSDHATSGDQERCRNAGMDDFLVRPVDFEALDAVLRRFLGVSVA